MKAYSMDLRERVVAACDAGGATREQVAARFAVSVRWVRDLLRRRRETGSIAPRPRGGGRPPAFDEAAAGRLRDAVRADDDATLEELGRAAGVACGAPAVYRALKRLGITRKKSRGGRPSRTAPS
jgi:transposase